MLIQRQTTEHESVYQHCCLCSKDHNRLAIAYSNVIILILNGSVPADVVHAVLPYRSVYIVLVHACMCVCGLLAARYSAIIINKASQLSRQHCSLTACLQTLDHLVFLSTSGLLSQHSATASPSISRSLSLPFRSLSFYVLIFFTVWGALDWTAAASSRESDNWDTPVRLHFRRGTWSSGGNSTTKKKKRYSQIEHRFIGQSSVMADIHLGYCDWLIPNKTTCTNSGGWCLSVVSHQFRAGTFMSYWLVTSLPTLWKGI